MRNRIVIADVLLGGLLACAPEAAAQNPVAEAPEKTRGVEPTGETLPIFPYSLTPGTPNREYIYAGDRLLAIDEGNLAVPAAPDNLSAVACFGPEIYLIWTDNSSDETGFTLERKAAGGVYTPISLAANMTAYLDTALSASTTYSYRIKASNAGGDSAYSSEVSSATGAAAAFSDDPIVAGVTPVRAVHVSELRQAVNSVRACARLAASSWSNLALAGDPVYAADVQELRDSLGPALSALGTQTPAYTDNPVATGTAIKKVHVDELRQAVQ
ncbi:MAG: fibronectin type III domain-containing protein [Acidobacteria bacterium]|nr:fibronectin type III domain-containing protein [Acidobacteriota bacterium]